MKKTIKCAIVAGTLLSATAAFAHGGPAQNINPGRQPNMAAAQALSRQAFDRISAAQWSHEFDNRGHASRAKALLMQANDEMKLATVPSYRPR